MPDSFQNFLTHTIQGDLQTRLWTDEHIDNRVVEDARAKDLLNDDPLLSGEIQGATRCMRRDCRPDRGHRAPGRRLLRVRLTERALCLNDRASNARFRLSQCAPLQLDRTFLTPIPRLGAPGTSELYARREPDHGSSRDPGYR